MSDAAPSNADQIDYWNAAAGDTWARFQDRLDRQLDPLGLATIEALGPRTGERILDIGCGCGHSTLQLAARVWPGGEAVGVDISRPMLDVAERRATSGTRFAQHDAQTDDLGAGAFDAVFSRFGVMFFNDPAAAFANIRRALKPGGRLAFVCWRSYAENPWMREPMEAAERYLPPSPPRDPTAPGPYAFADADRVKGILEGAGFADVRQDSLDVRIGGGSLEESLELAFKVGPLGAALRENPQCADQVVDAVRAAMKPYDTPHGLRMPSATWIVQARNP